MGNGTRIADGDGDGVKADGGSVGVANVRQFRRN